MTGFKHVMLALFTLGKATQSLVLSQRIKKMTPTSKDFMHITLVSHIPNQLIAGAVENSV